MLHEGPERQSIFEMTHLSEWMLTKFECKALWLISQIWVYTPHFSFLYEAA